MTSARNASQTQWNPQDKSGSPTQMKRLKAAKALRSLLSVFELDHSAFECPQCHSCRSVRWKIKGWKIYSHLHIFLSLCSISPPVPRAHMKIHGHECRDNIYVILWALQKPQGLDRVKACCIILYNHIFIIYSRFICSLYLFVYFYVTLPHFATSCHCSLNFFSARRGTQSHSLTAANMVVLLVEMSQPHPSTFIANHHGYGKRERNTDRHTFMAHFHGENLLNLNLWSHQSSQIGCMVEHLVRPLQCCIEFLGFEAALFSECLLRWLIQINFFSTSQLIKWRYKKNM